MGTYGQDKTRRAMNNYVRILAVSVLTMLTQLVYGETIDGVNYSLDWSQKTASVTYGDYSGNIEIPSTIVYEENLFAVTSIGSNAFSRCEGLTSVSLPEGLTSIGNYAFYYCTGLTSISFPKSLTSIGRDAFEYCTGLTSISFPESLSSIGYDAFYNCTSLTSISLPEGLTSIESNAFSYCTNLTTVIFNCTPRYSWSNWWQYAQNIVIGENVTEIENGAFRYSRQLKEIRLQGNSVPTLGQDVFVNEILDKAEVLCNVQNATSCMCDNQWSQFLNIHVEYNGERLVPIPTVVGTAGIKISGAVYADDDYVLARIGSNVNVKINGDGKLFVLGEDVTDAVAFGGFDLKVSAYYLMNRIYFYPQAQTISVNSATAGSLLDLVGMDNVRSINMLKVSGKINGTDLNVLKRMENLTFLDLSAADIVEGGLAYYGNATTHDNTIGTHFVDGMTNLRTLILPYSAKTIDENAFYGMTSLENVVMKDFGLFTDDGNGNDSAEGITAIGNYAFQGCSNLLYINIPGSVSSFGRYTFSGCNRVVSLKFCDSPNSLNIPTYDGTLPKQSLYSLYLGRNLTGATFQDYNRLSFLTIGPKTTAIAESQFRNCTGIEHVIFPESVSSIGYNAFYGCSGLKAVYSASPTTPDIQSSTFDESTEKNATLYVPTGCKTAYWLHQYWGNFYNIVETDDFEAVMGIENPIKTAPPGMLKVYTLSGQLVKVIDAKEQQQRGSLPTGIYIVGGKKVIVK